MKKLNKIIIIISFIIILAIILLAVLKKEDLKENKNNIGSNNSEHKIEKSKLIKEINHTRYYTNVDIIVRYYNAIYKKETNKVYDMIDKTYLENKGISKANILSKLTSVKVENIYFSSEDMYVIESENIKQYYIKGKIKDNMFAEEYTYVYFNLNIVSKENTFKIKPLEKKEYEDKIKKGSLEENVKIEKNQNNTYKDIVANDQFIVSNMMNDFKFKTKYEDEKAYNILNKDYREEKFKTFEEFEKYLETASIKKAILKEYSKIENSKGTTYIAIDQYGNSYVFEESAVMEYNVMLDTYTIDSKGYIEKYKSLKDEEKVINCLAKVFEAINNKDYKYVYGKLNQTFRKNNFDSIEKFEKYVKENFYINNNIEYLGVEEKEEYKIINTKIINSKDKDKFISRKFIIGLVEETNFEMSFTLE